MEDLNLYLKDVLTKRPHTRVPSADTVLRGIEELATENISYTSEKTGNVYDFNTAEKLNQLLILTLTKISLSMSKLKILAQKRVSKSFKFTLLPHMNSVKLKKPTKSLSVLLRLLCYNQEKKQVNLFILKSLLMISLASIVKTLTKTNSKVMN